MFSRISWIAINFKLLQNFFETKSKLFNVYILMCFLIFLIKRVKERIQFVEKPLKLRYSLYLKINL